MINYSVYQINITHVVSGRYPVLLASSRGRKALGRLVVVQGREYGWKNDGGAQYPDYYLLDYSWLSAKNGNGLKHGDLFNPL